VQVSFSNSVSVKWMRMMNNSFEGIVLKKVDYRDYDAMLSVLTASGKRSVLARGINKISSKNAHCCQLFTLSRFNLLEKGSALKNAELIKSYRGLREDLLKQGIAQLMMEVMDRLEEMMFGYEELLTCLDLLETAKQPYCILTLFLALIAHEIGIEPNVDSCCRCGSKQQIAAFSINDGGFVCQRCQHSSDLRLNVEQLRLLRLACKAELKHAQVLLTAGEWTYPIVDVYLQLFQNYSGINLQSAAFLRIVEGLN